MEDVEVYLAPEFQAKAEQEEARALALFEGNMRLLEIRAAAFAHLLTPRWPFWRK